MGLAQEFKEFAVKGNVADMAVGIIIGAAFGKIVSSLVSDVLMPPLGLVIGGVDFTSLKLKFPTLIEGQAAVTVNYGVFIQTIVDFLIVAFAMFMVVKMINRLKKQPESAPPAAPPAPSPEVVLLTEIRDALAKNGR